MERDTLEDPISLVEVNDFLKATRNNVSLGVSGFSGAFYKMFWGLLNPIRHGGGAIMARILEMI